MLDLLNNSDLIIDGISEVIRQGQVRRSYTDADICKEIDLEAYLDLKKLTFALKFRYRAYPASHRKQDD